MGNLCCGTRQERGERMRRLVYTLRDPRTGAIKYVGCSKNPAERLERHIQAKYSRFESPMGIWTLRLIVNGLRPVLHIESICTCGGDRPHSPFDPCELALIRRLLNEGVLLYNTRLPDNEGGVYIRNPMLDYIDCQRQTYSASACNCRACRKYRRLQSIWKSYRPEELYIPEPHLFDLQ